MHSCVSEGTEPPVFEIEFWNREREWVLLPHDTLVPFAIRFRHPEPGMMGAVGYAKFMGRKTGGLIRVKEPQRRPRVIFFSVERL